MKVNYKHLLFLILKYFILVPLYYKYIYCEATVVAIYVQSKKKGLEHISISDVSYILLKHKVITCLCIVANCNLCKYTINHLITVWS